MNDQNALAGLETEPQSGSLLGGFGQGITEMETRAAILEIEAETPTTGARRATKQLCIALASSIDKGNAKGRSIANEASQLFMMMQQLQPTEPAGTESAFTDETKRLFDALAAPAQLDAPPEMHAP